MRGFLSIILSALSLVAFQLSVCNGQAGSATLTPPSTAVNASSAYGLASLSLSGVALSYSIVATSLSGPITMAHFHLVSTKAVVYQICSPCAGFYLAGTWANASANLMALTSAGIYINIHTSTNGGGEISGTVTLPFSSGPPYMAATFLTGPSMTAYGVATLSLSSYGGDLTYTVVSTNLTGPITMAHFHAGAAGVAGGVLSTICSSVSTCSNKLSGTWMNTSASASALASGAVYINLHTAANPGGEIRGQVMVGSMQTTAQMMQPTAGSMQTSASAPMMMKATTTPAPGAAPHLSAPSAAFVTGLCMLAMAVY